MSVRMLEESDIESITKYIMDAIELLDDVHCYDTEQVTNLRRALDLLNANYWSNYEEI